MTDLAAVRRHTRTDTQTRPVAGRHNLPADHDTTEVRWFAGGPPPSDVRSWFNVSADAREERCDRYLVDQVADVGIRERGATAELSQNIPIGLVLASAPAIPACQESTT